MQLGISGSDQDVVVSPYLRDVSEAAAESLSVVPNESCEGNHPPILVMDELNQRFVRLGADVYAQLQHCSADAHSRISVAGLIPDLLDRLIQWDVLIPVDEVCGRHAYRTLEVEVNSNCNFRCSFCPVSIEPRPARRMSISTYKTVLHRAFEYGIRGLSLNHYSEPTLDPQLETRILLAKEAGLDVELYTNASGLTPSLTKTIAAMGNTRLVVNFPSGNREEYESIVGRHAFDRVLQNLRIVSEYQISTTVVVNAPRGDVDATLERVDHRLGDLFGSPIRWAVDDRAGRLENSEYFQPVRNHGLLGGCILAMQDLNVSWEGKVFLCAQDYDQTHILGDLLRESLEDVATSQVAQQYRGWIIGLRAPPPDLMCTRCAWAISQKDKKLMFQIGNESRLPSNRMEVSALLRKWPVVDIGTRRDFPPM